MPRFTRAFRHRNYRLFFCGQLDLAHRHLDAVGGRVVAGLPPHRIRRAARRRRRSPARFPSSSSPPSAAPSPTARNRHRILVITQTHVDGAAAHPRGADASRGRVRVVARLRARRLPRHRQRLRHPGAAGVRRRDGRHARIWSTRSRSTRRWSTARASSGRRSPACCVAAVGEGWCFLLNGVSYIAVITGLLLMSCRRGRGRRAHRSALARHASKASASSRARRRSALCCCSSALVSFAGMPYSVLMPIFAESILHGGRKGLGLLMARVRARRARRRADARVARERPRPRALGRGVGRGVRRRADRCSRCRGRSGCRRLLLLPVGDVDDVQMASSNTLIQAMVPDALRGRVMAVYSMMFMGMAPIRRARRGLRWPSASARRTRSVIGGCICVVGAIVFNIRLPALRVVATPAHRRPACRRDGHTAELGRAPLRIAVQIVLGLLSPPPLASHSQSHAVFPTVDDRPLARRRSARGRLSRAGARAPRGSYRVCRRGARGAVRSAAGRAVGTTRHAGSARSRGVARDRRDQSRPLFRFRERRRAAGVDGGQLARRRVGSERLAARDVAGRRRVRGRRAHWARDVLGPPAGCGGALDDRRDDGEPHRSRRCPPCVARARGVGRRARRPVRRADAHASSSATKCTSRC